MTKIADRYLHGATSLENGLIIDATAVEPGKPLVSALAGT